MTYEDAYRLDSGLRESMDLTIVNPYFSHNADYQGGVPILLYLNGFDEMQEPVEMFMALGADWVTADGGKTITHPTKTRINKSSIYGHWLEYAKEIPELSRILYHRAPPTQADIWQNLILHLELREIRFGKNIDPIDRLMPVGFLGEYSDTASPTPPVAISQQPATVSPADLVAQARAKAAGNNGTSPLYAQMIELAKASDTFPNFLTAALGNPEVLADDELAQQVADEGGIWATAKS